MGKDGYITVSEEQYERAQAAINALSVITLSQGGYIELKQIMKWDDKVIGIEINFDPDNDKLTVSAKIKEVEG